MASRPLTNLPRVDERTRSLIVKSLALIQAALHGFFNNDIQIITARKPAGEPLVAATLQCDAKTGCNRLMLGAVAEQLVESYFTRA
jgi:hypothetical protein